MEYALGPFGAAHQWDSRVTDGTVTWLPDNAINPNP